MQRPLAQANSFMWQVRFGQFCSSSAASAQSFSLSHTKLSGTQRGEPGYQMGHVNSPELQVLDPKIFKIIVHQEIIPKFIHLIMEKVLWNCLVHTLEMNVSSYRIVVLGPHHCCLHSHCYRHILKMSVCSVHLHN